MLRNSFKFLSLVLVASLIVTPISAIGWNSDSSRWGLGLAVVGLVGVVVYNYYFSSKTTLGQNLGENPGLAPKPEKKSTENFATDVKKSAVRPAKLALNPVKIPVKSATLPEIEPAKKPLDEESIEKPAMELEIEPTISNQTEYPKSGPRRCLITLANLKLNHVENQKSSDKQSEQPNKIAEVLGKLKKTKINKTEHKYERVPTALGNNSQFAHAVERNK